MTDFSLLNLYFGIEVMQGNFLIRLCQISYAFNVLDEFNMRGCNSSKSPMECCLKLNREGEGAKVEPTHFRKLIRCLRYLILTRPDLAFYVSYLSRFMSKPWSDHMDAAKRILRYVKRTIRYGLVYKSNKECQLVGYYDNNYARDLYDRKSTSRLIFIYGSKPIAWNCCQQKVIAMSSCGAQYISSTLAVCQGIWINIFIRELIGSDFK